MHAYLLNNASLVGEKFVIKDIFITLLHYYIMQLTPDYPRWSLAGESQKIKIPIRTKDTEITIKKGI